MGLIYFFIKRYNLKEFFSYELNLFSSFIKLFIGSFYAYKQILYRASSTLKFVVLLFVVILLQEYFIIFFFLVILNDYFKLNNRWINNICSFFTFFDYNFFLLNVELVLFKYKYNFFLIFFKLVKIFYTIKFLINLIFFKLFKIFYSFKFFRMLPRTILYFFIFSGLNSPKYIKAFFVYKFRSKKFSSWDSFFFKFFFNIIEPVNIAYFMFLFNNTLNYYIFNRIIFIHYKLMSIPMENPQFGNVQIAWLAYAGPITFYFFLVRWNYYSDSNKKFIVRHYYREKTAISYLKNFLFIFYFYFSYAINMFKWAFKKLIVFIKNAPSLNLGALFYSLKKKQNFLFFLNYFYAS